MAPKTDLSGTKFLIAAAAIAGTVGGWTALSLSGSGTQSAAAQDSAINNLLNQPLPVLQQSNGSFIGPVVNPSAAGNQPAPQTSLRKVVAPAAITRSSRK